MTSSAAARRASRVAWAAMIARTWASSRPERACTRAIWTASGCSSWTHVCPNAAVLAVIYRGSLPRRIRSAQPKFQLGRALFQMGAIVSFFYALKHVPLATATALGDLNPVIVTLGALWLAVR